MGSERKFQESAGGQIVLSTERHCGYVVDVISSVKVSQIAHHSTIILLLIIIDTAIK